MNSREIIAKRISKVIYKEEDKVIKTFDKSFKKSDILNEALNHSRVEETDLNIPKLYAVSMVDDKWSITIEHISGKTLEQLMNEDKENIDKYMEMFVDLQIEMHTKKVPMLNKIKEKMQRKISQTSLDATTRYELHTRLESMPEHHKLCHGDYNPSNVIIKDDGTAYIIDWSHATQGNASADAARTYLLFCLKGQNEIAEKYINLFCKKCDIAKQYVQQWIPIVAASQSVKGKQEEKELLFKWADVLDYQ